MEILGLAIVVVLLLLAATFVIRFLLTKKSPEYRKSFISAELASGMINTILKTTATSCSRATMKDLLEDCATSQSLVCEDGQGACDYFDEAANGILIQTLNKWNYKYQFTAVIGQNSPFVSIGSKCLSEKKSETYVVPSSIPIQVKLDICG